MESFSNEERLQQRVVDFVQRHLHQMESKTVEIHGTQVPWSHYQARAKKTGKLDFDCQFSEGRCKRYKDAHYPEADMGCCSGCANMVGYLQQIPINTSWRYANLYDGLTGFWRVGQGCILPREMRSPVCLSYNCHKENHGKLDMWGFLQTGKSELIQIAMVKK